MRILVSLLTAAFLFVAIPAAAQAGPLFGKTIFSCTLSRSAQDDPIVNPGAPGAADHNHDFYGGFVDAFSTFPSLLSGPTTCSIRGNHTGYWAPSFVASDGSLVHSFFFHTYYGGFGKDPRAIAGGIIQPFPPGLKFIVGNSHSTVIQSTSTQFWRCYPNSGPVYAAPPSNCPSDITGTLRSPSCWNGTQLDSPDHQSHMSGAVQVTLGTGETVTGCPPTHPVAVPALEATFDFRRPAVGWEGSYLDSDHGVGPRTRSWHMDVMEAWDPLVQAELVKCFNDPNRNLSGGFSGAPVAGAVPLCGNFGSPGFDGELQRSSLEFDFVNPDGSAKR